jgi:hypothetical protein
MPAITVPNVFSSGAVLTSNGVNKNVYDPNPTDSTLDVLHGGLTEPNFTLDASVKLPSRVIRPATRVAYGSAVIPLDVFRLISTPTKTEDGAYQALIGAGARFFIPRDDSRVVITAHCSLGVDAESVAHPAAGSIALRLNGSRVTHTTRSFPPNWTSPGNAISYYTDRVFTFSHTVELDKGWHTADVALWGDCPLVRVRSRGIFVVVLP